MTTFIKNNTEFNFFKDSFIKWCMFMYNKEYPLTDINVCNYAEEVLNSYLHLNYGDNYAVKNILFDENSFKGSVINLTTQKVITEYYFIRDNILTIFFIKPFNKYIDDNKIRV